MINAPSVSACACGAARGDGAPFCGGCGRGAPPGGRRWPWHVAVSLTAWAASVALLGAVWSLRARPLWASTADLGGTIPAEGTGEAPTPTVPQLTPTTSPATSPPRGDRLVPVRVAASSFMQRRGDHHPPEHAFDGNDRTAWNDGVEGSGQGQWIEARFDGAQRFRRARFSTGFDHVSARLGDLFYLNAHMSQAAIEVDGREVARVPVGFDQRRVVVDLEVTGASLRIVAADVFAGSRWQDVCVSEVEVEGYATAGEAPAAPVAPSSAVAPSTPCTLVLSSDFHLRATASRSRGRSRSYPAGQSVEVLAPTDVYRHGEQRLYYVRVASDGERGYVFLLPSQRARCGL